MGGNLMTPEEWGRFWAYFKSEPQQVEAIQELYVGIHDADPCLVNSNASWVRTYRTQAAKPKLAEAPYFNQLLMDDGQGWRDCFSATCGMIAAWAGKVEPNTAGENRYNHIRQKHGDSTVAQSQIRALQDLGLVPHYGTNGTKAQLIELLDKGIPVGTGILHHGRASSPTGGGHWMLIVGHDDRGVIALDPYGELDVVNGTWAHQGSGGDHVHYSWTNWLPRWEVAGGDGYMLWVEP